MRTSDERHSKNTLKKLAKLSGIASAVIIAYSIYILTDISNFFKEQIAYLLKPEPAYVNITKVVDEDNQDVQPSGTTPSRTITFHYQPLLNGQPKTDHTEYICYLDSKRYECNNSGVFKTPELLDPRPHQFHIKVNDSNTKYPSNTSSFYFTVGKSVSINGTLVHEGNFVTGVELVMDNKSVSWPSDTFGQFVFPYISIKTTESNNIFHQFSFNVTDKQNNIIKCNFTKNLNFNEGGYMGRINLNEEICPKISNSLGSAPFRANPMQEGTIAISTNNNSFKLERDQHYAKLDLLYNTSIIRKPTSNASDDGIWNVIAYLDGPELSNVSKVTYLLHPTFKPNDIVTINKQVDNTKYSLPLSVYGGFKFYAKVFFDDGRIVDLSRYLLLEGK